MIVSLEDRYVGCLLGLGLGDALGAPHEGGPIERLLWKAIGKSAGKMRWTDDTQMSLDLAESLIVNGKIDADDLARRFACSYRWSRGYGPGASKVLKRIRTGIPWGEASRSVYAEGSFGNGGAMRAPIVGLFYHSQPAKLAVAAEASARVTHAHPLGVEGAVLLSEAIARALTAQSAFEILDALRVKSGSPEFQQRLDLSCSWLQSNESAEPNEVRSKLGNGISDVESCVTALYLALRFLDRPFSDLIGFVVRCKGDVDTIGSMAGALWGAANGATRLPAKALAKLEQRNRLEETAYALLKRSTDLHQ